MNIGKCEFPDFTPIVTLQKTSLKRQKITWLIRLSEHSFWNLSCISLCFRIWIEEGYGNPPWQMDARIGLSYILTSLLYANCLQTFMANSSSFVYASFFAMQKMVWHFVKYSAEIQTLSNYSEKAVWASMTTRQTVATKLRGVD